MHQPALSPSVWLVADLLRGDCNRSEIGKVIPFNSYLYLLEPPRLLAAIAHEVKQLTGRTLTLIQVLSA